MIGKKTSLLAGCVMLAHAVPALAQSSADGSDIIVTARRVEERLQDVPISITVFNQQQLSNRNIVNAQDLAVYTPSLSSNNNFGAENSTYAIRGFVQDTNTPPSVGVYFADVVAPRAASNGFPAGDGAVAGNFFDLQNVQVLKGPQGTLFGRNTTGGAVLFVPQKPTGRLEGYIEGSYGNFDMQRIQAVINIPLMDSARLRLGVDRMTREGYLYNDSGIGPARYGDTDYTALRGSLVIDLTPNLESYSIASYTRSHTNGQASKIMGCNRALAPTGLLAGVACAQFDRQNAQGDFYHLESNFPNAYSVFDQWQLINTTTWRASDTLTIKNIVSYAQLHQKLNMPLFATNFVAPTGDNVFFAAITPAPGRDSAAQSTITEEFQIQGSTSDQKLTYQTGVYLESSKPLALAATQSPTLLSCTDPVALQCKDPFGQVFSARFGVPIHVGGLNYTPTTTTFHSFGVFAQATYSFTDQLKLTGGIRYTRDRQVSDSARLQYQFPVTAPLTAPPTVACGFVGQVFPNCNLHLEKTSSAPTWMVDIDYKPTDDILLYAKYSRGYRAGGVLPTAPAQFREFNPEKVDTYEAGLKASFHGAVRGSFNIAGFYNDFSNQQLSIGFAPNPAVRSAAPLTGAILNAGRSRIYGAEVEASITPLDGLTLNASYTYLNTRIKEVTNVTLPADDQYVVQGGVGVGDPLALSPRNKVSINGSYTLPLDESIGQISLGATFTHTDKQLSSYSNPLSNPANAAFTFLQPTDLLNLNLNWNSIAGAPLDLSLFATNVTQRKYYSYFSGLYATIGFEVAVQSPPRMFGARLRYRFGKN